MRARASQWLLACAALISMSAQAADVGGWFSEQQRPQTASGQTECAQAIRQAASDATAGNAYRAALCYLQAETSDTLAATAWLSRSAEMKFLPADRLLRSLQAAQAGPHSATMHAASSSTSPG